jgi:hypothetical protein
MRTKECICRNRRQQGGEDSGHIQKMHHCKQPIRGSKIRTTIISMHVNKEMTEKFDI